MPYTNRRPTLELSERKIALRIMDVLMAILSIGFTGYFLSLNYIDIHNEKLWTWIITYAVYFLFFGYVFELYDLKIADRVFPTIRSLFISTLITTGVFALTPRLTPVLPEQRIEILVLFLAAFTGVFIWRVFYVSIFTRDRFNKNLAFVGDIGSLKYLEEFTKKSETRFNILGALLVGEADKVDKVDGIPNINRTGQSLYEFIVKRNVDELIVCKDSFHKEDERISKELADAFEQGINIRSLGDFYSDLNECIPRTYLGSNFFEHLNFSSSHSNRFYLYFSRVLDILFAIVGLTLFSFLIPFIVLGNILGNRGSFFYKQKRMGKKERPFQIIKLRTMVKDAEKNGAQYAQKNDSRITWFGRILRNTRLDEVPQLINVLKGEMKMIGPRPERPVFIQELSEIIPFYRMRHTMSPGLTGWAQVKYPYANSVEEQEKKLRYDLYYLKNRSFYLDFQIIVKTVTTVLFFRGQ